MHVFKTLKQALFQGPALSLPTGDQFKLFVTERSGIALEVLTQPKGSSQESVSYLGKQLNSIPQG